MHRAVLTASAVLPVRTGLTVRAALGRRAALATVSLAAIVAALIATPTGATAQEASGDWPPPECPPATRDWRPAAGTVGCVSLDSAALGGLTPVAYHVPEACAATTCPVLYNLHGFGGDHTSQLGTAEEPSAWVEAITRRPTVDPSEVDDPWSHADPEGWEPAPPLPLIQVTTYGRTVPGGYGPGPGLEGFYSDWNPRYAAGGENQAYDTPPPRFETFLVDELLAFVEDRFRTRPDRSHRAISGVSLGGFGGYKLGLQHPDRFAAIGSVSGAHNFLFAPAPDSSAQPDTSAPFVVDLGGILLPSTIGGSTLPLGPAEGFTVPFTAYGDTAADQPFYRGNMPVDLATNGRAFDAGGAQLPFFRAIVNDAVARRGEDVADPGGFAGAQALEAIVLAMNLDMEIAWGQAGVERTFEIHPGLHSGVYWNPWIRQHLEGLVAHLATPGTPPPAATSAPPAAFDYRTIDDGFPIWGWRFEVERDTVEFLDLTAVTCDRLTLRGTGTVTVDVPDHCGTGREVDGVVTDPFTVELGPGAPTAGPTGVNPGAHTVTIELDPLPTPVELAPAPGGQPGGRPGNDLASLPATGGGAGAVGALLAGLLAVVAARRR